MKCQESFEVAEKLYFLIENGVSIEFDPGTNRPQRRLDNVLDMSREDEVPYPNCLNKDRRITRLDLLGR